MSFKQRLLKRKAEIQQAARDKLEIEQRTEAARLEEKALEDAFLKSEVNRLHTEMAPYLRSLLEDINSTLSFKGKVEISTGNYSLSWGTYKKGKASGGYRIEIILRCDLQGNHYLLLHNERYLIGVEGWKAKLEESLMGTALYPETARWYDSGEPYSKDDDNYYIDLSGMSG